MNKSIRSARITSHAVGYFEVVWRFDNPNFHMTTIYDCYADRWNDGKAFTVYVRCPGELTFADIQVTWKDLAITLNWICREASAANDKLR